MPVEPSNYENGDFVIYFEEHFCDYIKLIHNDHNPPQKSEF